MKNEEELLQFLFEEVGGEDAALLLFHRRQVAELASTDKTISELMDSARNEGWLDWLLGIRITDLANIVNPPEAPHNRDTTPVDAAKKGARLTAKRRDELYAQIVDYLRLNPGSAAADVAHFVGWDPRKLAVHIARLKKEGKVTSTGERISMRYSLPAEEPKAVPPFKRKK